MVTDPPEVDVRVEDEPTPFNTRRDRIRPKRVAPGGPER